VTNGIGRLTLRQKYKRREKGRRQHTLAAMARILVGSEADLKDPGMSLPTSTDSDVPFQHRSDSSELVVPDQVIRP